MKKRPVEIYRLELRSWEPPHAKIFVHCSSGTYIRSLARDIAVAAGSRAHLIALLRTRVAGFKLENAVRLGTGGAASPPWGLLPIDKTVFQALNIPCLEVSPEDARKVFHGKPLSHILKDVPLELGEKNTAALFSDGAFIAMIEKQAHQWNYGYVYASN